MPPPEPDEFRCECGRPRCTATVRLGIGEYEDVRRRFAHFIVALGHATSIDRPVAPDGGGEVVAEVGAGAEAAAAADDPRATGEAAGHRDGDD